MNNEQDLFHNNPTSEIYILTVSITRQKIWSFIICVN